MDRISLAPRAFSKFGLIPPPEVPCQSLNLPVAPEDSRDAQNMPAGELFVCRVPNLCCWVGNRAQPGAACPADEPALSPPWSLCKPSSRRGHAVVPLPGFKKQHVTWMVFEPVSVLNALSCHL